MINFIKHAAMNWKTSVAGLVYLAGNTYYNGTSLKQLALGALVAWLGLAAKDGNVTGGTKQQ